MFASVLMLTNHNTYNHHGVNYFLFCDLRKLKLEKKLCYLINWGIDSRLFNQLRLTFFFTPEFEYSFIRTDFMLFLSFSVIRSNNAGVIEQFLACFQLDLFDFYIIHCKIRTCNLPQ